MKVKLIYDAHRRLAVERVAAARGKPMSRLHHGNPAIAGLAAPLRTERPTKSNAGIERWRSNDASGSMSNRNMR